MANATHTAGPWGADYYDGKFGGEPGWMVRAPHSNEVSKRLAAKEFPITVRKICDVSSGAYVNAQAAESNANLIAAAPDFREAGDCYVRWIETYGCTMDESMLKAMEAAFGGLLRAAITKATGSK